LLAIQELPSFCGESGAGALKKYLVFAILEDTSEGVKGEMKLPTGRFEAEIVLRLFVYF